MSNFVEKKLETKKRKKRSISPGYNWIEKETINPLPELPLENKITADDMNYLHAMAVKPLVLSQIKVYRGTSIPAAGAQVVMTVPEDEEFVSAYMAGVINGWPCYASVHGENPATGSVQQRISPIPYMRSGAGESAVMFSTASSRLPASIGYFSTAREVRISSSDRLGGMSSNTSDTFIYYGTASSRSLTGNVITVSKGGD